MVEVFKTNVEEADVASMLLDNLHRDLPDHKANFDLEDHDRILRVKCKAGPVESALVINLIKNMGFNAEILADELVS